MSGLEDELEQKGEQELKEKVDSELGGGSSGSGQSGSNPGDQSQGDQSQGGDQGSQQGGGPDDPSQSQTGS